MKRIFIAGILSALAATYAIAADLPQPLPQAPAYVPIVAPVYNWTGIYVGINGGWGWGSAKWSVPTTAAFPAFSGTTNDSGGVVGGTLGGNFQTGPFVFGVEGDFDYSAINTGTLSTVCAVSGSCQTGNNWLATIRGRAGYAWDRVLFYGTAGGIFGNVRTTFNGNSSATSRTGWTAGAGVEWAFAENWTAKIEYLFADFGNANVTCASQFCINNNAGVPVPISIGLTESLIRAGVNLKFNY